MVTRVLHILFVTLVFFLAACGGEVVGETIDLRILLETPTPTAEPTTAPAATAEVEEPKGEFIKIFCNGEQFETVEPTLPRIDVERECEGSLTFQANLGEISFVEVIENNGTVWTIGPETIESTVIESPEFPIAVLFHQYSDDYGP
jgi:hypothetical protein